MEDVRKYPLVVKVRNKSPESGLGDGTPTSEVSATRSDKYESHRAQMCSVIQTLLNLLTCSEDKIKVIASPGEKTTTFHIQFPQEFSGKIIGSQGKHISALRNLILGITAAQGYRSTIEIPYYEK